MTTKYMLWFSFLTIHNFLYVAGVANTLKETRITAGYSNPPCATDNRYFKSIYFSVFNEFVTLALNLMQLTKDLNEYIKWHESIQNFLIVIYMILVLTMKMKHFCNKHA